MFGNIHLLHAVEAPQDTRPRRTNNGSRETCPTPPRIDRPARGTFGTGHRPQAVEGALSDSSGVSAGQAFGSGGDPLGQGQ